MNGSDKILTAIIDDDEEFVFALKEHLGFFPEIQLQGSASKYNQAKNLLLKEDLELVFMDIEMPVKTGFELLEEARKSRKQPVSVIFYTAFDKYLLQGLRESAFDYLMKPVTTEDLRAVIDRYKVKRKSEQQVNSIPVSQGTTEIISLPTPIGLRFMDKNNIIMLQCTKEQTQDKPGWKAILTDMSEVKLRNGTTAKELLDLMGKRMFVQINQSAILNLQYLGSIEFKTRDCQLIPPFNGIRLLASRTHLSELRNKYDTL
jgi:two-component system LytT family response regulator